MKGIIIAIGVSVVTLPITAFVVGFVLSLILQVPSDDRQTRQGIATVSRVIAFGTSVIVFGLLI